MFQIVTNPVLVFTAVSVPAVIIVLDAYKSTVELVRTMALFTYAGPVTYNCPPIPTPPTTTNAPVVVDMLLEVFAIVNEATVIASVLVLAAVLVQNPVPAELYEYSILLTTEICPLVGLVGNDI